MTIRNVKFEIFGHFQFDKSNSKKASKKRVVLYNETHKNKKFKGKLKVFKIKKGHPFLDIYFRHLKSCYPQVLGKNKTLDKLQAASTATID